MMNPERIQTLIANGLPCETLRVEGDGQHFEAVIVSTQFAGKTLVQRQRMVNAALRASFDSGELHALSMKTLTPEEWSVPRG
jgi:acid stress-induced BolA-like protein IbaG/YrbA